LQVVILCGGKGTRLGDVTGGVLPKPMVSIGAHPILWHIMRHYARAGHNQFILAAGHLNEVIKDYFLNFHARNTDFTVRTGSPDSVDFHCADTLDDWTVTIADTGDDTMTAGRLKRIAHYLQPGNFMLTYGDGVSDIDLASLEKFHVEHGGAVTITGVVPPGRFGELRLDGNRVAEMQEKPSVRDRYINAGFMVFKREFIDRFISCDADPIMLEREPFSDAAQAGEMHMFKHDGFWQCMDTARDWAFLNELWNSPKAPWIT
jgi:glucose-1-phosphate cytidylyltransferase